MKKSYFSICEIIIWCLSVIFITSSFAIFDRQNYLTLIASLIGATSLILNAKGNVIGQILGILFSIIYACISFRSAYYGEMITYLGMTAPIALLSAISWFRNPFEKGKSEVKINYLSKKEYVFLVFLAIIVMTVFYFILSAFNTAQLFLSTLSVLTSFIAVYLTMRRSEYYAIGYALNDIVLILLWIMDGSPSMIVCFTVFLVNDLYGFINWKNMKKKQLLIKNY